MDIDFRLDKMTVRCTSGDVVVSGSVDYLRANFKLVSNDWQPPITALFNDVAVILDDNNSCIIPWEVTQNAGTVSVSAYCGDVDNDNYLHTANCATFTVDPSCYKQGETPKPPTPDVYQSILNKAQNAENVAQSVRDDADAGKFDGKDGANGTTFTPHIEPVEGGNALSWTNDGGKPNPETVTIKDGESVYCDNQPKHTATGELIALDDVYAAQPLALGVEGKTSKNLYHLPTLNIWESSDIQVSESESGVKVHVVANQDTAGIRSALFDLPAGQYTFSLSEDIKKLEASISFAVEGKSSLYAVYSGTIARHVTFTVPANVDKNSFKCSLVFAVAGTYDFTFHPMLVEGSTPQPWTPSGLTCVESAEIEIAGKNLADVNPYLEKLDTGFGVINRKIGVGQYVMSIAWNNFGSRHNAIDEVLGNGSVSFTNADGFSYGLAVGIPVFNGQEYVATAKSADAVLQIMQYDKDGAWLTADTEETPISKVKIRPDTGYAALLIKGRRQDVKVTDIQLEVGSTATPYEPYHINTLPIDLKSNKLCSLPNGAHDELRVTREGDRGHVELTKRVAEDMETALPESQTIDLGYIDLPELPAPNATVWSSTNLPAVTSSVEYVQDINIVLDKLMQAIVAVPAMI